MGKLAKWTTCALLAGSEYLKMGYVSRYNLQDSNKHVIIGTQQFIPKEFAAQINLHVPNTWGILRCVIDLCLKQEPGKLLIQKVCLPVFACLYLCISQYLCLSIYLCICLCVYVQFLFMKRQ